MRMTAVVQVRARTMLAMLMMFGASTMAQHSTTTTSGQTDRDLEIVETKAPQQLPPQLAYVRDPYELDAYQEPETTKHLREPASYLERLLLTDELEKRASMRGFQGMRGKKSVDPSAFLGYSPAEQYYVGYDYEKRAPMGFQGMRGKKSAADEEDAFYKRAPMGFQGMRGKKSLEEVLDELEKRAMMGFQGMRGKKSESAGAAEWSKRAPMGFQGMRGRKSSFLDELDELEKRALLGFHGMRGKKSGGVAYERSEPADIDAYVEKRPMMMGFHGMRGKRSTGFYGVGMRYEKRSSPYRFFGTRGKKNPRWEMRGKFVGVRGKKWSLAPRLPYDELLRH